MKPISEMPQRETRNPYNGGGAGGRGARGVAGFLGRWLAGRRPGLEGVGDALLHRHRSQRDDEEARDTTENHPERELQQARQQRHGTLSHRGASGIPARSCRLACCRISQIAQFQSSTDAPPRFSNGQRRVMVLGRTVSVYEIVAVLPRRVRMEHAVSVRFG